MSRVMMAELMMTVVEQQRRRRRRMYTIIENNNDIGSSNCTLHYCHLHLLSSLPTSLLSVLPVLLLLP